MEKRALIEAASLLVKPSEEARAEYLKHGNKMVNRLNEKLSQRDDLNRLIGEGNLEMMYDNHRNHLRFMASIFKDYNPVVFTETLLLVYKAYQSHGFQPTYWAAQLNSWIEIMEKEIKLSDFDEIFPFYNWMVIHTPDFSLLGQNADHSDSMH